MYGNYASKFSFIGYKNANKDPKDPLKFPKILFTDLNHRYKRSTGLKFPT